MTRLKLRKTEICRRKGHDILANILRNSPGKLYLHVAEVMRQRLRTGEWTPGERLKPLAELAQEFDVANVTLRQAVAILETEGMLRRRQGSGTFVTDSPIQGETFSVGLEWPQILDMITKTTPRLLHKAEGAALPHGKPSDCVEAPSYTYLRRVNSLNGRACLVADAYIDSRIYARAPERFETETIIPVIESLPGIRIATCRQVLTIGQADMKTAALLELPVNAPMGDIKRTLTDPDGVLIYYNDVSYRGDMVRFEIDLNLDPKRHEE